MIKKQDISINENLKLGYWSQLLKASDLVDTELYTKYQVKRGLRDINGKGVVAGLTRIGEIHSYIIDEGESVPIPGKLFYRGYDIDDLVNGTIACNRFGF